MSKRKQAVAHLSEHTRRILARAAAFDARIRALIVDRPFTDYHRVLVSLVETSVGKIPAFAENALIKMASRFLPKSTLEYPMWVYGVTSLVE